MILAGVPKGTIVRVDGQWGVVCAYNVIDLWWDGRVRFQPFTRVQIPARQKP